MKRVPLALLLLATVAGLTGCLTGYFTGMNRELREHGVSAEAAILKVWDTGWTVNNDPVIGMRVEVRPSGAAAYEATIPKTLISRIDLPQFQPGQVVPVRYDPSNPADVAVDFSGEATASGPAASDGSGNPYSERFVRAPEGPVFLPPPAAPEVYLGTADSVADEIALVENGYAIIGESVVTGGPDPQQAVDQGKQVGAGLIVLYGHYAPPAGGSLAVLPFHPRPARNTGVEGDSFVSRLTGSNRVALYLGKIRPAILGASLRPVGERARGSLKVGQGAAVFAVAGGSPAEAAGIERGDILVSIDGKPVENLADVTPLVHSAAGRKVQFDLLRAGSPLSVAVQLNSVAP